MTTTQTPRKRSRGARTFLIVTAAVASLMSIGLMGLGALALWGDAQKDEQGYLATDSERFGTATHALATDNLDIDLDGAEGLVDSTGLGDVKLDVVPRSDEPVFVGIARTDEVSSYLDGVAHAKLTDVDHDPFRATYSPQGGTHRPTSPAGETIWAASAQGAGPQTLTWEVEDGDWSVVVMNADGSPGLRADVAAAAKLPFLDEIGWSGLGAGVGLALAAAGLLVLAVRPRRSR